MAALIVTTATQPAAQSAKSKSELGFAARKSRPRMLGWFQALMPKEERFFTLFEKHATIVVAGAEALRAGCCRVATQSGTIASKFSSEKQRQMTLHAKF
jgi:hypothetical protein